jgi:hypothetical protein
MWDKCVVECLEEAVGTFSLFCKFNSVLDQFVWAFSGVYGPNSDSKFQIDIFCGRSSPGYLVGGRFPCASEGILMLPVSLIKELGCPV